MPKLRVYALLTALTLSFAGIAQLIATNLAPGIEQQKQQQFEQQLLGFLKLPEYAGTRLVTVPAPASGWPQPIDNRLPLYQVWRHEQLYAVLIPVAGQGFRGPIQLRVAFNPNAQLLASQVLAQQETPGLGGQINNSRWLEQFTHTDSADAWQLRSEGGEIDQISGATVTSKSVSALLQETQRFYLQHRQQLERRL